MQLNYVKPKKVPHLIDEFYTLEVIETNFPFQNIIIPLGFCGCSFTYESGQKENTNKEELSAKDLIFSGVFNQPYSFEINKYGYSCGVNFTPSAMYKITKADISKYTNKLIPLLEVNKELAEKLSSIFIKHKENPEKSFSEVEGYLAALPLYEDIDTQLIDKAIALIQEKEGLLSIEEVLNLLPYSQKTLETKFKRIIGLTPGCYMRLYRFISLMRKYDNKEISLTDLIYKYNYYDQSHFLKDFKKFTLKSPKNYFEKDYTIVRKYLAE